MPVSKWRNSHLQFVLPYWGSMHALSTSQSWISKRNAQGNSLFPRWAPIQYIHIFHAKLETWIPGNSGADAEGMAIRDTTWTKEVTFSRLRANETGVKAFNSPATASTVLYRGAQRTSQFTVEKFSWLWFLSFTPDTEVNNERRECRNSQRQRRYSNDFPSKSMFPSSCRIVVFLYSLRWIVLRIQLFP